MGTRKLSALGVAPTVALVAGAMVVRAAGPFKGHALGRSPFELASSNV